MTIGTICLGFFVVVADLPFCFHISRADGGISNNYFVMQLTTDLIMCEIEKPSWVDMSCRGAAFLAGLAIGMPKILNFDLLLYIKLFLEIKLTYRMVQC